MTLREERCLFTRLLCAHVLWLWEQGYEVALGEGLDRLTAKDPTSDHMHSSLHDIGLAQDLDLYKQGVWLSRTPDHTLSGSKWETRHPLCRWGGRFRHADGNHYSLFHEGTA